MSPTIKNDYPNKTLQTRALPHQAQTQLSLAHEPLSHPGIEVHIASLEELGPRIPTLNMLFLFPTHGKAAGINQQGKQIHSPLIDHQSLSNSAAVQECHRHLVYVAPPPPPGFWGAPSSYQKSVVLLPGWETGGKRITSPLPADVRD